jgi:hypothetical protein
VVVRYVDIGGILMQAFGIAMVCYYIFNSDLIGYDGSLLAIFIISAILISLKYWETFYVYNCHDEGDVTLTSIINTKIMAAIYGFQLCSSCVKNRLHPVHGFFGFY